jgi:hypothetical protein
MAQNTLYPLVYKPGIKRDGTTFQADYCTDGQWVRFQRGCIRKMGSMKGLQMSRVHTHFSDYITNIAIIPLEGDNSNMDIYTGDNVAIFKYKDVTQGLSGTSSTQRYFGNFRQGPIWKSEVIIQNQNQYIVYLASINQTNINSSIESTLIAGKLMGEEPLIPLAKPPKLTGLSGLLYTSNYLFVYGSNGLVQWSKLKDPLDFTNADQRSISISNDQVIDAKAVRGGNNTPTILFWTLTSVIKCINTGAPDGNLQFQIDVLSRSSSILSTRCVVEYDGMFFWPGTERFFHYNGIVKGLPNHMSLNYFFDNLDMDRRQQVVGVKNTEYEEIWWFYPERKTAPSRDPEIPTGLNSRALIYNIAEKTWYDTSISRSAATYSEEYGFMCSGGRAITRPGSPPNRNLYRHEFENFTTDPSKISEILEAVSDVPSLTVPIPSSFTTPVFSWAAFNPMKQFTGTDRWMFLTTIEPDFILTPPGDIDMEVIVNTKQYAQNAVVSSAPYPVPPRGTSLTDPLLGKIDVSHQGRHMSLTFRTTSSNFEMGHVMLNLSIGDGK